VGESYVESVYGILKNAGVKISGVWIPDWTGQHRYPEGVRPLWNWKLN